MTPHHAPARVAWRKSSRSTNGGNCVEVAPVDGTVVVRDSKDPDGPVVTLTPAAWRALISQAPEGALRH